MGLKVLFSDIDGTCVHYSDSGRIRLIRRQTENGDVWEANSATNGLSSEVLVLPRSTSGSKGFISKFTLQLFAAVRQMGIKLVLISGCRSTTLLQRLPFLPFADAYVCESGGRIFYLNSDLPTAVRLKEDTAWRARHEAAGPTNQEDLDPNERAGVLWSYYEALVDAHFKVDAVGYSTAIRIRTSADRRDTLPQLPPELTAAENLGSIDIFPATSGKLNAAVYLMNKFGADENGKDSIFMCDDDNDLELALKVKKAFLPSLTSDSIKKAVRELPEHFIYTEEESVFATEAILQDILSTLLPSQNDG